MFRLQNRLDSQSHPTAKCTIFYICRHGEMAYTVDSKSAACKSVWVQVPLPALKALFGRFDYLYEPSEFSIIAFIIRKIPILPILWRFHSLYYMYSKSIRLLKKETQRLEHCHMLFSPGFSMKHTAGDIY